MLVMVGVGRGDVDNVNAVISGQVFVRGVPVPRCDAVLLAERVGPFPAAGADGDQLCVRQAPQCVCETVCDGTSACDAQRNDMRTPCCRGGEEEEWKEGLGR